LFVGLAAGTYSSIFLATPIVADLKEREPEQVELRKRVLARRSAAARNALPTTVASARRGARREGSVALAERDGLPVQVAADVVVESPGSVRREPGSSGATAPRPGARPQRPGNRPAGKKRR
jgi:preprotein translocase subunit SecF